MPSTQNDYQSQRSVSGSTTSSRQCSQSPIIEKTDSGLEFFKPYEDRQEELDRVQLARLYQKLDDMRTEPYKRYEVTPSQYLEAQYKNGNVAGGHCYWASDRATGKHRDIFVEK